MSSKRLSPAASALRSSRLFSLPPALRHADGAYAGVTASNRLSNTATAPYPTQQAITTPPSSLARGDWGLKRSLPLRSTTKSSTPSIRINAVDTREHITDYDSAADMSRTLDKFRELGIPLTRLLKLENAGYQYARSVFEPELDHTDPDAPAIDPNTGRRVTRWRFQGPHLAGLTEDEFKEYLTILERRKSEFLAFVNEKANQKMRQDQIQERRHSGHGVLASNKDEIMSGEQFDQALRQLRTKGRNLIMKTELALLINDFLDLPGKLSGDGDLINIVSQPLESAPPSHPSGGLGYLRTDAILVNHPVFGPQNARTPQTARIMQVGDSRYGDRQTERVGLAGFIAESERPRTNSVNNTRMKTYQPTSEDLTAAGENKEQLLRDFRGSTVGIAVTGGNTYWAEPKLASLDERGHVRLTARNSSAPSVGAHTLDPELALDASARSLERLIAPSSRANIEYKPMKAATGFEDVLGSTTKTKRYGLGKSKSWSDLGDDEDFQATLRELKRGSQASKT